MDPMGLLACNGWLTKGHNVVAAVLLQQRQAILNLQHRRHGCGCDMPIDQRAALA